MFGALQFLWWKNANARLERKRSFSLCSSPRCHCRLHLHPPIFCYCSTETQCEAVEGKNFRSRGGALEKGDGAHDSTPAFSWIPLLPLRRLLLLLSLLLYLSSISLPPHGILTLIDTHTPTQRKRPIPGTFHFP